MENTNISWTDHSWNGWVGCQPISPGCGRCYAKALVERFGGDFSVRKRTSESNWKQPLKWNREATEALFDWASDKPFSERDPKTKPCRPRVFCASMSDWLDDEVPIEWLADLLKLIHDTPNLDWLLLTKRPENFPERVALATYIEGGPIYEWASDWIHSISIPNNVWIGTSVENQEYSDKRIPELLKIPARVRFLSAEPLLGDIVMLDTPSGWPFCDSAGRLQIHQVIAGGESGKGHRPMQIEWMRSLHDQCRAAGVAWFAKQDSGPKPGMRGRIPDDLWAQEFPT